jgi:CubicO group peptidase (beta-lactamase class C family)
MNFLRTMVVLTIGVTAAHAGGRISTDVSEHIAQRVQNGDCVGIVLCIVDAQGSCCVSEGRLSKDDDRKVGEKTVFEIGSITKAFTGTLLADMVLRGEVSLDDPVQKYLPDGAKMPTRGGRQIALRDLSTHHSSLPRLPHNLEPADPDNPYADYTEKRMLDFLSKHELSRDIGEKYEYSNLGVGLLGYALSRRAGKPYEQLVVERICTPLGMNNTRATLTDDLKSRLAKGHSDGKQVKNWDLDALAGAGALRSTPLDMVNFIEANIKPGDTPISKALRASYKDRMETGTPDLSIGLGWHVWNKHGTEIIWHNGGTGGYRSFCGFAPDKKLGVVVLANSDFDLDAVGLHALEPKFELPVVKKAARITGAMLEDFLGYYELQPEIVIHITSEGDQLFAQLTGQPKFPVFAESDSKFFFKVVDAQISFMRSADGKVSHLVLHQNGDHKCEKITDYKPPVQVEVPVDPKILETYMGKYELKPGIGFDVKLEGGQLQVMLTGQPRFPVFAKSENKFFYKVVEAQLTFVKDESGKVTSLILHQGGIDQTAKRKD